MPGLCRPFANGRSAPEKPAGTFNPQVTIGSGYCTVPAQPDTRLEVNKPGSSGLLELPFKVRGDSGRGLVTAGVVMTLAVGCSAGFGAPSLVSGFAALHVSGDFNQAR